jgi:hypothetical protein
VEAGAITFIFAPGASGSHRTPTTAKNQLHNYGAKIKVHNKESLLIFTP